MKSLFLFIILFSLFSKCCISQEVYAKYSTITFYTSGSVLIDSYGKGKWGRENDNSFILMFTKNDETLILKGEGNVGIDKVLKIIDIPYGNIWEVYLIPSSVKKKSDTELASEINNKGIIEFDNNNYDLALEYYDKAIEIDPNNPIYYFNSGSCCMKLDLIRDAETYFLKVLEVGFNNISDEDWNKSKYSKHEQEIRTNTKLKLSSIYNTFALKNKEDKNYISAIDNFIKSIEYGKNGIKINVEIGSLYFALNDYINAVKYYLIAEQYPNGNKFMELNLNMAISYFKLGDFLKSKEYFERYPFLILKPDFFTYQQKIFMDEMLKQVYTESEISKLKENTGE